MESGQTESLALSNRREFAWVDGLKVVDLARIVLNHTVEPIAGFPYLANPGESWPPVGEHIAQRAPIVGLGAWTLPVALIRHLGRFWGSVGYAGLVPRSDLILPVDDGSTQRLNFGRTRIAVDIPPNMLDVLDREIGVGVGADLTNDSFCMPRHLDLTARVAGSEEADEFRSSVVGEPFIGPGQQPSESMQWVVFAASMSNLLVLDSPADFAGLRVRELHQLERAIGRAPATFT